MCDALYTGLGGPKAKTTAETVVRPLLEKMPWRSWDAYWSSWSTSNQTYTKYMEHQILIFDDHVIVSVKPPFPAVIG